jgi:ABC-type branched-subunit amino acid transport system ATPase component
VQKQHIVEDVQRLLHLYQVRNVLLSELAQQPAGLKRLGWRLSLGMELVGSPSLLLLDGIAEGVCMRF